MSVEPWVMFSSILLKAKKKENNSNCCIFSLSSASDYSSSLGCAQVSLAIPGVLGAAPARAGLQSLCFIQHSCHFPPFPYPALLGQGKYPKDFLLDTEMLASSFQAQQMSGTRGAEH